MPPSIITVLIRAHGADLPDQPFSDETVRIISFAGRSGSIFSGTTMTASEVKRIFDEKLLEYQRKIPTKGKKKFLSQLYEDNPNANRCENTPMFSFDEEEEPKSISSAKFLEDSFVNPSKRADESRDIFLNSFPSYNREQRKRFEAIPEERMQAHERFTYEDAMEDKTFRMHTPVINKMYAFTDPNDPDIPERYNYGIHVFDICNYDRKAVGHVNIKVGDDLTKAKSRSSFNAGFADSIIQDDKSITLERLCEYLHSIGFHTINILDASCRYAGACYESEKRTRITEMEEEQFSKLDLAHGRIAKSKKAKKTKTKTKAKKSKKSKSKSKKSKAKSKTKKRTGAKRKI